MCITVNKWRKLCSSLQEGYPVLSQWCGRKRDSRNQNVAATFVATIYCVSLHGSGTTIIHSAAMLAIDDWDKTLLKREHFVACGSGRCNGPRWLSRVKALIQFSLSRKQWIVIVLVALDYVHYHMHDVAPHIPIQNSSDRMCNIVWATMLDGRIEKYDH